MFQTMADLTPVVIGIVGIAQVGVVVWGIRVMRDASLGRSKQTEVLMEALLEMAHGIRESSDGIRELSNGIREASNGIREASNGIREASNGIRELLDRDMRRNG